MTVTTTSSKVVCLGNGSTTVFAFPFLIPVSGQEQIIYTDTSGVQTTLVASQYTITGFGNPAGGTVTYPKIGAPIPSGATLTIARVLPLTQPTSISNQGAFYPSVVESSLDNATMQIQQIAQGQAQALKGPIVDSTALGPIPAAAQRANQLLGFDSTGQPIAAQPSSALVSAAMQPVVDAATVAAAVGLLGIPVFVGAGTTTGSANAQVIAATTPSTFTLTAGFRVAAIPGFTNNSAMTLAVAGTGTKNVMKRSASGPVALIGGEVVANQLANWTYDGTQFILEEQGTLTNPTISGTQTISPTSGQAIGVTGAPAGGSSAIVVNTVNPATGAAAFVSLNRAAVWAVNFGLDTDNYLKVGGWSLGANAYKIMHEGLDTGTFTGSYAFSGTVNITGSIQKSGVAFPITKSFESAQQTITSGGALTLAHGLGAQPKHYQVFLQCVTAENGFAVGNEIIAPEAGYTGASNVMCGILCVPDATNLNIRFGGTNPVFQVFNFSTGGTTINLTNANWRLVARAWA